MYVKWCGEIRVDGVSVCWLLKKAAVTVPVCLCAQSGELLMRGEVRKWCGAKREGWKFSVVWSSSCKEGSDGGCDPSH